MKALLSILNFGQIPQALKHTYITLIPKKKHHLNLYNVLYKLISKVIANRLKVLLPLLIANSQSIFVPLREITDNILVAYKVIQFLRRKNKSNQGLSL